jgi:hypothetical protein
MLPSLVLKVAKASGSRSRSRADGGVDGSGDTQRGIVVDTCL